MASSVWFTHRAVDLFKAERCRSVPSSPAAPPYRRAKQASEIVKVGRPTPVGELPSGEIASGIDDPRPREAQKRAMPPPAVQGHLTAHDDDGDGDGDGDGHNDSGSPNRDTHDQGAPSSVLESAEGPSSTSIHDDQQVEALKGHQLMSSSLAHVTDARAANVSESSHSDGPTIASCNAHVSGSSAEPSPSSHQAVGSLEGRRPMSPNPSFHHLKGAREPESLQGERPQPGLSCLVSPSGYTLSRMQESREGMAQGPGRPDISADHPKPEHEACCSVNAGLQEADKSSVPPENSTVPGALPRCGWRLDRSNLDCFLEHTTPAVQCQYTKTSMANFVSKGSSPFDKARCMPYFNLGDLWSSFDEWSAYGAGVPLCLPTGETIVQYYVPYLSALQIYLRPSCSLLSKQRRAGDDSDSSDAGDFSSEFSSDSELDKLLRHQVRPESWDTASCVSSERSTSVEEGASDQVDRQGDLAFEFFERSSPYGRAPLREKISELALEFPHLHSLQSNELAPASWVSVAWYPIYRIPTGPTMRDLATCFLTFHSLWTPSSLQDEMSPGRVSEMWKEGVLDTAPYGDNAFYHEHGLEEQCPAQLESRWRVKSGTLELPAFGLASYKLRGPFWASAVPADKRRASSLASSADSWLKQLRVQHPDFNFFASRGSSGRHY